MSVTDQAELFDAEAFAATQPAATASGTAPALVTSLTAGPLASPEAFTAFARTHGWRVERTPGRSAAGGVEQVNLHAGDRLAVETYWVESTEQNRIRHFGCYVADLGGYAVPARLLEVVAAGPVRRWP